MRPSEPQLEDPWKQLRFAGTLQEHRFRSRVPVVGPWIAWLREMWNSVSTKWYVRPLLERQNDFNGRVVDRLAEHAEILHAHQMQSEDHEVLLTDHDRAETRLVHDLAEVTARLVLLSRQLADLDQRLARLEATRTSDQEPR